MKAILEFDMDEPQDRKSHLQCVKAQQVLAGISNFLEAVRCTIKMSDSAQSIKEARFAEEWREVLLNCMIEKDVDLDELI